MVGKERRREERVVYEDPESVSVFFTLPDKKNKRERVFNVDVLNCSNHGIGMLVTEKDHILLTELQVGDEIRAMRFYNNLAVIEFDGIVAHKTEIDYGEYEGFHVIGIQSKTFIDICKPWKDIKE
jgi:hypothetical protein